MSNVIENGIDSLRFFLGNGNEIQMKKQFSARWEIIPDDRVYKAFFRNPEGHIELRRPADITSDFVNTSPTQKQSPMYSLKRGDMYSLTVSGTSGEQVLKVYGGLNGLTVKWFVVLDTEDEVEIKLIVTGETTLTILPGDGYSIHEGEDTQLTELTGFMYFVRSDDEFRLTIRSLTAVVAVDNPGIVSPVVTFSRNQDAEDYVRSYQRISSDESGVVTDDSDPWMKVPGRSLKYTIDNVFDIIFFSYRTIDDEGNETVNSNKLRLTLNDGDETVEQDYYLEDFFQGSVFTCVEDNLTVQKTLETTDDGFFAETAEELLDYETKTGDVYGVKPELFAQTIMEGYSQYPDEMLDDMASLVTRVRSDQERYSNDAVLSSVMSVMERYEFESDYWNSKEIVAIIRGLYGNFSSDEQSAYDAARRLLDILIYSDSPYIINQETVAYYTVNYNIPESQFPYVRYVGSVLQDIVSSGFVMPETIVVVKKEDNGNYVYPKITDGTTQYRMHFRFGQESEMFFVQMKDSMEMFRQNSLFALLPDEINLTGTQENTNTLNFTVGFQAEREGCYQNVMGIFVRDNVTNEDFLVGAVEFKTTVEGEDERYRTLTENLGIPDPRIYPNIFREQDPDEQGVDWRLVNRKSKELMLSFDQIFPYSGTYKALFQAIKFLGYQDVVFKEWYKIIDSNDNQRYVSVQNFDTSTGQTLRSMLKSYGVEYSQYQRYSKLNRLAMVYHMQEVADYDEEMLPMYDSNGNEVPRARRKSWEELSDEVPAIRNIYEFRNDELLAKLYQVKLWLERYVTGVGCYISDINGENVVLERIKNQAHVTSGEVKDITSSGKFTPHAHIKTHTVIGADGNEKTVDEKFTDSSVCITCSLNEFRSVSFDDYADFPIERFVKWQYDEHGNHIPLKVNTHIDGNAYMQDVYVSAPLNALTVADELSYTLNLNNPESGSLYEFADSSCLNNPIMVSDGEITLFDSDFKTSTITNSPDDPDASNECPVIEIIKGNIREVYGDWSPESVDNNIAWSILYSYGDDNNRYIRMTSMRDSRQSFRFKGAVQFVPEKGKFAQLQYTSVNKWELPLFIMRGYYPANQFRSDYTGNSGQRVVDVFDREKFWVVEILEGSIRFRNHKVSARQCECTGAEIVFEEASTDGIGEQQIRINYRYDSERKPIYSADPSTIKETLEDMQFSSFGDLYSTLDTMVEPTGDADVPVNRLGQYEVHVKAYDAYNTAYVNKSDDTVTVRTEMPSIDIIVNQEQSGNSPEFYMKNVTMDPSTDAMSADEILAMKEEMDSEPKFPPVYKIYSAQHDTAGNEIVFDNISYAVDTLKKDEMILLTNLTESVLEIDDSRSDVTVFRMSSSNPRKQNVYNLGGTVTVCAYDERLNTVVSEVCGLRVLAVEEPSDGNGSGYVIYPDGSITTDSIRDTELYEYVAEAGKSDSVIRFYVIDTTEIDITGKCNDIINTSIYDVSTGTYRKIAFIPVDDADADNFKPDTMIRFQVSVEDPDVSEEPIVVNQSAYRVITLDVSTSGIDASVVGHGYFIDGHVDICSIDDMRQRNFFLKGEPINPSVNSYDMPELKVTMAPLHSTGVQYELRVTQDADETLYVYQDYKFYGQKTTVIYDSGQLMFDEYMDDQYAAVPMKYDPLDLYNIWFDRDGFDVSAIWFKYSDFPVTVTPGRKVVLKNGGEVPQLMSGWKTSWKWSNYVIEDLSNIRDEETNETLQKKLLFESDNKVLNVMPELLGTQNADLSLTDLYGNVIKNSRGGNLYVRDDSDDLSQNIIKTQL